MAIGAALLVALAAPPAGAAAPGAHGYWWRLQSGSGSPLPPPPFVPHDGLWVASNGSTKQQGSSQMSVSAVLYQASPYEEIRSLVLTVHSSSGSGAVLLACPASTSWKPAEGGPWDQRPQSACDVAFVKGVRSADGKTWSFDVRGLARSGTLDAVILPPADASTTFSVAFDPPGASSVVTHRFPGSPSPSPGSPSPTGRPSTPGSSAPQPVPSVLAQKTTRPAAPGSEPLPSADSPSADATPLASAPFDMPGYRSPWILTLAWVLPAAVCGGLLRARWYD